VKPTSARVRGRRTSSRRRTAPSGCAGSSLAPSSRVVQTEVVGVARRPADFRYRLTAAVTSAIPAASSRLVCRPRMKVWGWASRAPKTATARAPPSCRLGLNTPPAVPARCPGTAFGARRPRARCRRRRWRCRAQTRCSTRSRSRWGGRPPRAAAPRRGGCRRRTREARPARGDSGAAGRQELANLATGIAPDVAGDVAAGLVPVCHGLHATSAFRGLGVPLSTPLAGDPQMPPDRRRRGRRPPTWRAGRARPGRPSATEVGLGMDTDWPYGPGTPPLLAG